RSHSSSSTFFFSSRRRHTRLVSDWSSDVCSSDLTPLAARARQSPQRDRNRPRGPGAITAAADRCRSACTHGRRHGGGHAPFARRSEERRVGEEGRSGGWPECLKKKEGSAMLEKEG